jgi:hypothetical protein
MWLVGDVRFDSEEAALERGFASITDMWEGLAMKWRDLINPGEEVYVIGPLPADEHMLETFELWMRNLPGRKIRIAPETEAVYSDAFWYAVQERQSFEVSGNWGEQTFVVGLPVGPDQIAINCTADSDSSVNASLDEFELEPVQLQRLADFWSYRMQGMIE